MKQGLIIITCALTLMVISISLLYKKQHFSKHHLIEKLFFFFSSMFFILAFAVMPLAFAMDSPLVMALSYIVVYFITVSIVPHFLKELNDLRNSYEITSDRYNQESKKNRELQQELESKTKLLKRYEELVGTDLKLKILNSKDIPYDTAITLLSDTYNQLCKNNEVSTLHRWYQDVKESDRLVNEHFKKQQKEYRQKDLRYDKIEAIKTLNNCRIVSTNFKRGKAILTNEVGKEYTLTIDYLTTQIEIPCSETKGKWNFITCEVNSIMYAYYPNTNKKSFYRFVQSEADEGVVVKNTIFFNQPSEIVSTHNEKFIIKVL